jgi:tetratricopeptide (TPR) repeat protein
MTGEYSVADLRRILRLDGSQLRACLRAALLPPPRGQSACYSFQNLVMLRTAKGLTDAGVSVARIRKVLECLERQLGEETAISSLKIYASGKRVVVWDGASRWQPDSGQFLLNFETAHMLAPRPLTPRPPAPAPDHRESAQRWFQRALALQEDSPEEARRAYEEAISLDPALADAHINLGLLHHDGGHLVEAERCYRRALEVQPGLALAHFNLGVVLEDRQKKSAALKAYQEALKHAPDFVEAHCNLAQLYEKLGRKRDAFRHYAAANRLSS